MSLINEDEAVSSVGNIASYPSVMLKTAIQRKNIMSVDSKTFKNIKNMSEDDIVNTYKMKTPFLISSGKKHLLVSKL